MGDSKRIRKLSLNFLRETLSRKNRGVPQSSVGGPTHLAALDLASTENSSLKSHDSHVMDQEAASESIESKPSILKSLRKRFQMKSNTEPSLKIMFKSFKASSKDSSNVSSSKSTHELYARPCEDAGSSSTSNSGSSFCPEDARGLISRLEEELYTEAQSVLVDLGREGVGYETCDLPGEEQGVNASPQSTSLTCQLLKLSKSGWYWGPISREEAEEKLLDQPDGAFLVRDSSADRYLLSLSFRSNGKTLHTRIEHSFGLFSFYSHPEQEGFGSIVELIDHSMHFSQSGVFCYSRPRSPGYPAFPVRLTKPISRFTQVRSLQYLCRFVIRQNTRVDNIHKLPLPPSLKGYLEEGHY